MIDEPDSRGLDPVIQVRFRARDGHLDCRVSPLARRPGNDEKNRKAIGSEFF